MGRLSRSESCLKDEIKVVHWESYQGALCLSFQASGAPWQGFSDVQSLQICIVKHRI